MEETTSTSIPKTKTKRPSSTSNRDRKPNRQAKLEEQVLSKSHNAIKHKNAEAETLTALPKSKKRPLDISDAGAGDDAPVGKRRKPRHATEEGQRFLVAKAKIREIEEGSSIFSSSASANKALKNKKSLKASASEQVPVPTEESESPKKKKAKKKKKKSKGKKANSKTNAPNANVNANNAKGSDSEERQRREAVAYLQLWSKHRDHWKFEKLKQVWLLKHALFELAIEDDKFTLLLDYVDSIKGAGREKTLSEMEAYMAEFEKKFGKLDSENPNPNSVFNCIANANAKAKGQNQERDKAKDHEKKEYDRARRIVQVLAHG